MNQDSSAIKIIDINKNFVLPHEKTSSLKELIVHPLRKRKGKEFQDVLKDLSFDIKKGEFFGVVGRNGSGKSTLLKIIAGVYTPNSGSVDINGSLIPFIELGVGFNPELTGRDNVYLNGSLLGFSRSEVDEMYDSIVEFAELERFMDQKLKNYSSGMQVRLAFSIAIRAESDILLIDEVLAVGDASFQKKCYDYFSSLKNQSKTVVLVTHDMDTVLRYCDRAALIEDGQLTAIGDPIKVTEKYNYINLSEEAKENIKQSTSGASGVEIVEINIGEKNATSTIVSADNPVILSFTIQSKKETKEDLVLGLVINNHEKSDIAAWTNTDWLEHPIKHLKKGQKITLKWEIQNIFPKGSYGLECAIKLKDSDTTLHRRIEEEAFEIDRKGKNRWVYQPDIQVSSINDG